ncbi:hypothetical protein HQ524_00420 [Candidatus Uhrbacteria bacterium]|nr:hypothetical protein [Candidatus Uhrbacteria bacterium]
MSLEGGLIPQLSLRNGKSTASPIITHVGTTCVAGYIHASKSACFLFAVILALLAISFSQILSLRTAVKQPR